MPGPEAKPSNIPPIDFAGQKEFASAHIKSAAEAIRFHGQAVMHNMLKLVVALRAHGYELPDSITLHTKSTTPGLPIPLSYQDIRYLPSGNRLISIERVVGRYKDGQVIPLSIDQQYETGQRELEPQDWLMHGVDIIVHLRDLKKTHRTSKKIALSLFSKPHS